MKLWNARLRPRIWHATMATDNWLNSAYQSNQHWRHAVASVAMAVLAACGSRIPPGTGRPRRKSDFSHLSPVWRLVFELEDALMDRYSARSYGAQAAICIALAFLSAVGFNVNQIQSRRPGAR